MLRISSLQSRLDEQRHRAEELHRQGTSDLNIRVHDLKVNNLYIPTFVLFEQFNTFHIISLYNNSRMKLPISKKPFRHATNNLQHSEAI